MGLVALGISLPTARPIEARGVALTYGAPAIQMVSPDATTIYLPFLLKSPAPPPLLLGLYAPATYLGDQQTLNDYFLGLDAWAGLSRNAGTGHSLAGDFVDFELPNLNDNVMAILETLWRNGYTAFLNIKANTTSSAIANGQYDTLIRNWARAYKAWLDLGGNRRAFLGPLQEMNGKWIPYGMDPANFKPAYRRIVSLFEQEGVPRNRVWWTFAPNGYSEPPFKMADYYPGDDVVDVIAFSGYNWGRCPIVDWVTWQEPEIVLGSFITEIRQTITTAKPIFIAETASTSFGGNKDQWLMSAYTYVRQQNVRGVFYFNADMECDWAVYQPNGRQLASYKNAIWSIGVPYVAPEILATSPLAP
jgi:hypothetical protein